MSVDCSSSSILAGSAQTRSIYSRETFRCGYADGGKRLFDFVVALATLFILLPLLIAIAAMVLVDVRGSPVLGQERWGRGGRKVRIYKFRSMRICTEDRAGTLQTRRGDPRVTRLGYWLRRLNLDELPQLWNVVRGDMSLVGPRCHPVGMLAAGVPYEELVTEYHARHAIRPGLTGLAQMRGLRGPTTDEELARARIACDLDYIRRVSLALDLRILWGTLKAELRGGRGS